MHFLMALVLIFVGLVGYGVHNDASALAWTATAASTAAETEAQFDGLELSEAFQAQLDERTDAGPGRRDRGGRPDRRHQR